MPHTKTLLSMILLLLIVVIHRVEGNPKIIRGLTKNDTRGSPWINKMMNQRDTGCSKRPWICNEGQKFPPRIRKLCCGNRCVDVRSDVYNCGLCGIRCPFTWQCCRGFCVNTNVNPFHCGRCENKCPFGVLCFSGMCGYAQPRPPFPFPFPPFIPRPPPFPFPPVIHRPPFPFPPVIPLPPSPFPFPPKPPKPHPPKGGQAPRKDGQPPPEVGHPWPKPYPPKGGQPPPMR